MAKSLWISIYWIIVFTENRRDIILAEAGIYVIRLLVERNFAQRITSISASARMTCAL